MVKFLSSLSHLTPPTPSKIQSTIASVTQSRPSLPIPNLITTVKNNPKSALAALTVVNPIAGAAVLAYEHKSEIKSTLGNTGNKIESTLGKAADTVKHEAEVIKKDTISVASTVKTDVTKVGKSVVSGIQNIYMYGMIAVGGLILLKFVI